MRAPRSSQPAAPSLRLRVDLALCFGTTSTLTISASGLCPPPRHPPHRQQRPSHPSCKQRSGACPRLAYVQLAARRCPKRCSYFTSSLIGAKRQAICRRMKRRLPLLCNQYGSTPRVPTSARREQIADEIRCVVPGLLFFVPASRQASPRSIPQESCKYTS